MKTAKWMGLILICSLLLTSQPVSPVQAAMRIDTDTTWSGYMTIDRDVVVEDGATLTVESGATILMACTDAENAVWDGDRIEIEVESGGTLVADGATFAGIGYPQSNCWYGIEYEAGSTGYIKNSTIRDGIQGVDVRSGVEISGNLIEHMYGTDGSAAVPESPLGGHDGQGIYVNASGYSPIIQNNEIRSIYGGDGVSGAEDKPSSSAGSAFGIYVYHGSPVIEGNDIHMIYGGTGGNGGAGSDGSAGSAGNDGQAGSPGGIAGGIYCMSTADDVVINNNEIYAVRSGTSGSGGDGGDGGNGSTGSTGSSGVYPGPGGYGGDGGDGGDGGYGFTSREAYGIFSNATSTAIAGNTIYNIRTGISGTGGAGGDGGFGGAGGDGGDGGIDLGGDGGNGGVGGNAGEGGDGGSVAQVYYVRVVSSGMDTFEKNTFSGGVAADGGSGGPGGNGGAGGDGGDGGAGDYGYGWGGDGGAAGNGAVGGAGGVGGMMYGVYLRLLASAPTFTNNIINEMESGEGGNGGDGGSGGLGGSGGTGYATGDGGDGGDSGNGGSGSTSGDAILLYVWDTDLDVVNNTFYLPMAPVDGGAGGEAGSVGQGGSGNSTGSDGTAGTDGAAGFGGAALGLSGYGDSLTIAINVFNNIFATWTADDSVAVFEESAMAVFDIEYNDFWNWTYDLYAAPSSTSIFLNNIDAHPLFEDAALYDFHLQEDSPCIDAGDDGATSAPDEDIEGNLRPLDGDGDGVSVIDLGAYEAADRVFYNYLPLMLK